jgi:hypothetical protein
MNTEPSLDRVFHVFGYDNTVAASSAQLYQMDRIMLTALNDMKRYGRNRRVPIRYAMVEDYFVDSVFEMMRDLTGDPPLPRHVLDLLEKYDAVHYVSDTAVRFYKRHGFELPGEFLGRTTRAAIPRQAGTNITVPVIEPLGPVA